MYFTLEGVAETQGINIWTFNAVGEASLIVLFIANMSFCKTGSVTRADVTSEKVCAQLILEKAREYPSWKVTNYKCVKM